VFYDVCFRFDGLDEFEGRVMHSCQWEGPQKMKNERVLFVGHGESASDMVAELGLQEKEKVYIRSRNT